MAADAKKKDGRWRVQEEGRGEEGDSDMLLVYYTVDWNCSYETEYWFYFYLKTPKASIGVMTCIYLN